MNSFLVHLLVNWDVRYLLALGNGLRQKSSTMGHRLLLNWFVMQGCQIFHSAKKQLKIPIPIWQ
jgi:hypothetical protein